MSSNNTDLMVGNRLLSSLRVVDLKQELEKRGLSKSGSKKDLVDRLKLHLQIEKHRDTGASADEEELPNYSQVHNELADQNPFIRDYLASQAELFHSQKVVKKLVEESKENDDSEAKTETATELIEEKMDANVAPSPRSNEVGEDDSKGEDEKTIEPEDEKIIEPEDEKRVEPEDEKGVEPEDEKGVEPEDEKRIEPEEEKDEESKKNDDSEAKPDTATELVEEKMDADKASSPRSNEVGEDDIKGEDEKRIEPDEKDEESSSREEESPVVEAKEESNTTAKSQSSLVERSPVREKTPEKERPKTPLKESKENDDSEVKTDSATELVEEKMDADKASSPRSNDVGEDDSKGEDEKRSVPDENDEESCSRGEESPATEASSKTPKSPTSSASHSPVREKSPEKEILEIRADESELPKDDEPQAEPEKKSVQDEEKMDVDESSSPRYKSSQKENSYTNNDIAGEEALDYGEEEDDEDRNESDPQEFSWGRRSLRFKNKSTFAAPTSKWKLEEDSKHLVVKSKLLNSYYDDIKLVPLEQLKLEEKSSETATENKQKEVERKPSISKEVEPVEPLLTRTVENIAPTIKRTVSIIPSTKTLADNGEEADKALTPPRNPPSDVLLITNLVRPFTLIQLKEMLQRTGNLQDIWVDKIKSKCIAKFGSQEEAFETRAALHGVCWPNSNPKSLHVDYTTQDNLDEHKAKEGAEQSITSEKPVSAQPVPVREWDVGKKAEPKSPGRIRKRSRSRSTSRDRSKRSRRSSSPGRRKRSKSPAHERRSRGGEGKEPEPMGKALDELFRKTVATPSIYWLPLTPEQIAEKEELRRKRMLERERRLAELSKMRPR